MDSTAEFAQLQLRLVEQAPRRYELIRPLVLCADRTATQRAHETATHHAEQSCLGVVKRTHVCIVVR